MKNFLILLVFICLGIATMAQDRIRFSMQNYVGLLRGENGSALQIQTISGIEYKKWNVGIGTGIDGYYSISSPLFLSLNRTVFKKGKNNFSVSFNGGIDLPWKKVQDHYEVAWGYQATKLIGAYWEGGINYGMSVGKRNHVLLTQFGFSYKHMGEKLKYTFDGPSPSPSDDLYPGYQYDYYLRTLLFKIGWGF